VQRHARYIFWSATTLLSSADGCGTAGQTDNESIRSNMYIKHTSIQVSIIVDDYAHRIDHGTLLDLWLRAYASLQVHHCAQTHHDAHMYVRMHFPY
jgi:hypothetical protein